MTEVEVIPFHPKHLELMKIRKKELFSAMELKDAYKRIENIHLQSKASATFIYQGRILMCAGFLIMWPGVVDGWIIPSEYIKKAPFVFAKNIKTFIESIARGLKCHRFQTTSPDDEFHHRWMTWLGFKKEGTMEQYTHLKENYCIYARIFKWQTQ